MVCTTDFVGQVPTMNVIFPQFLCLQELLWRKALSDVNLKSTESSWLQTAKAEVNVVSFNAEKQGDSSSYSSYSVRGWRKDQKGQRRKGTESGAVRVFVFLISKCFFLILLTVLFLKLSFSYFSPNIASAWLVPCTHQLSYAGRFRAPAAVTLAAGWSETA